MTPRPQDMQLIMENWRGYQDKQILAEQLFQEGKDLLEEGDATEKIRQGFAWMANKVTPEAFKQRVIGIKKGIQNAFTTSLQELAKDQELLNAVKAIAADINANKEGILNQRRLQEAAAPAPQTAAKATIESTISDMIAHGLITSTAQIDQARTIVAQNISKNQVEFAKKVVGQEPVGYGEFLFLLFKTGMGQFIFGFIDNFIMVLAGEYIDAEIASALQISTMGAAAIGNAWSDMIAELGKGPLDKLAETMGVDPDTIELTRPQKVALFLAGPIWIFIGAIVGWLAANLAKMGAQAITTEELTKVLREGNPFVEEMPEDPEYWKEEEH